jgi:acyl carrier protein
VLDAQGAPAAPGTPGEVVVNSEFVRPRLWGADGLTELATGPDPVIGRWAYRTGDRGLLTGNGELLHLGRSDGMVKVRGFRVELVEVEAALGSLDDVAEAAVVPYEAAPGEAELAAYVVASRSGLTAVVLRHRLSALVPAAMVPATVVFVGELPRTANGKVDRRNLPPVPAAGAAETPEPELSVQDRLLAIWRTVLRAPTITAEDDFFDAGGTSITALSVISRVRRDFGVPVRLAVLFETPTVAALAEEIRQLAAATKEEQ